MAKEEGRETKEEKEGILKKEKEEVKFESIFRLLLFSLLNPRRNFYGNRKVWTGEFFLSLV